MAGKKIMLTVPEGIYNDLGKISDLMEMPRATFILKLLQEESKNFPALMRALRAVKSARKTEALRFFLEAAQGEAERAKQIELSIQSDISTYRKKKRSRKKRKTTKRVRGKK